MAVAAENNSRLWSAILELQSQIDSFRRYFHSIAVTAEKPEAVTLIKRFVFDEINDLFVILEMIYTDLVVLSEIADELARQPPPQGQLDESPAEGRTLALLVDRERVMVGRLS